MRMSENENAEKMSKTPLKSSLKKLLNIDNNAKTIKGQKYKVMTAILYLAPAKISGFNVCPHADDCALTCLNTAGRGKMNSVQLGRINKTLWYFKERKTFMAQLHKEIKRHSLNFGFNRHLFTSKLTFWHSMLFVVSSLRVVVIFFLSDENVPTKILLKIFLVGKSTLQ